MTETYAAMRERMERRYWCDLLARLPVLEAVTRVSGQSIMNTRRRLAKLGIDFRAPSIADPPLELYELGLTLDVYMDRHERWYWQRLLGCRRDRAGRSRRPVARAESVAGIDRQTIYYRLRRLGIKTWRQNTGNAAWRALSA